MLYIKCGFVLVQGQDIFATWVYRSPYGSNSMDIHAFLDYGYPDCVNEFGQNYGARPAFKI